jgi:NADPH-dependent ferric siderophore reductase
MDAASHERHRIERVRREPKRRRLTVAQTLALTPKMLRIEFVSPELAGFASFAPDDHIKVFVADPFSPTGSVMRDYTPRAFDAARNALTIDFALHDAGPATAWALQAKPGDTLEIGGPRGSIVIADDFDYYLLIGDETALPAIGRRVEELRPGVDVTTIVVVDSERDIQRFDTKANWRPIWVTRAGQAAEDGALLGQALAAWTAPRGDGYVWIGAEARAAKALKTEMLEKRGHPAAWLKASGYWVKGKAGEADKHLEG